ncbi:MAG: zinc ribbon domain-containing protein [Deinococcales bacterium]
MNALELLSTIQAMDLELDKLRLDEASIPTELKAARDEKIRLEAALVKLRQEHMAVRRKLSEAELELASLGQQLKRAEHDQQHASSAKEQGQYASRAVSLRDEINDLTDDTLPLTEKLDELNKQIEDIGIELDELEPKLAHFESLDDERIRELQKQYAGQQQKRDELAKGIDEKVLRDYDQVRKAKKGIGFVRIVAGKCGGCKVQLTPNIVQRVRAGQFPVKCQSCGRILAPSS